MPSKILTVVSNVDEANPGTAVLKYEGPKDKPAISGGGEWDYLCGNCFKVACSQIPEYLNFKSGGGKNVLINCPACGAYNELPHTA